MTDQNNKQNAFSLLSDELIEKLKLINITEPTKVQNQLIPQILQKKNVVFQSETGTGKTLAYALPLVANLNTMLAQPAPYNGAPAIIVIAPTVELSSQINSTFKSISNAKTALFTGGAPLKRQLETLKEKPLIITGTAARIVELINLKKLKISSLMACVFDECDRLVKREAFDATDELRRLLPKTTQIIACSATINKAVKIFFAGIENEILPPEDVLKKNITHWALYAETRDKIDLLRKLINALNYEKILIFTSRSDQVENIYSKLRYKNVDCMAIHAKAQKQDRKAAIDKFRSGKAKILITSDLAARGLDISGISHVIQMDLPDDTDFFIHRSGRTARAGKTGINIVIGDEYEMRKFAALEKKLGIIVYPKQLIAGKVVEPIIEE